jgi:hypothetical protein
VSRPTTPVSRLRPADAEELLGMLEQLTRRVEAQERTVGAWSAEVARVEGRLDKRLDKHADRLDGHAEALDAHEDRLNTLDDAAAPKPRPGDELRAKVEAFVNATPIRLTALVVAEAIGEDNNRVGTALDTLARQGRIADVRRDGRTRMYHAKPAGSAS